MFLFSFKFRDLFRTFETYARGNNMFKRFHLRVKLRVVIHVNSNNDVWRDYLLELFEIRAARWPTARLPPLLFSSKYLAICVIVQSPTEKRFSSGNRKHINAMLVCRNERRSLLQAKQNLFIPLPIQSFEIIIFLGYSYHDKKIIKKWI